MTQKKIIVLTLSAAVVFTVSTIIAYSITRYLTTPQSNQVGAVSTSQPTASPKPVDAESFCPFNGKKYTVDDQNRWEARHPVAVMIENHPESRPQSGLSSADVVYEAVAEGGITRFMGLFLCDPAPQYVGPVRSARTYFLDWLSEYNAFYAHVGGANTEGPANALGQIKEYGIKDFEGLSEDGKQGWQRDQNRLPDVAREHTMYLDIERLRQYASDRFDWNVEVNGVRWDTTFEKWKYIDAKNSYTPTESTSAASVAYEFWDQSSNLFAVEWKYNPVTKTYSRNMAGRPHVDKNTEKQLEFSNIIIMLQEQSNADDGYTNNLHLLYKNIGTGKAWVVNNGRAQKATWSKSGRTARTKFIDTLGKEIPLERGKIWLSIVPTFSEDAIQIQ